MSDEPIQTEEVVALVTRLGECAVVHQTTGVEVLLFHDRSNEREPYEILALLDDIPSNPQLTEALELGFSLRRSVDGNAYALGRRCLGIRAAAQRALILARVLSGANSDERLWLTSTEPDLRDEPPVAPTKQP